MNGIGETVVRTACGRELTIGRLRLDGVRPCVGRVTLDVGCEPYDRGEVWASLTPDEARCVALALLDEADAAEAGADLCEPARPVKGILWSGQGTRRKSARATGSGNPS